MITCPQCQHEIFLNHSDLQCAYYRFKAKMFTLKYQNLSDHPDLKELLATTYPREILEWPLDPRNPAQGKVISVYFPRWLENAVNLYHNSQFGMELSEFLNKMAPQ